MTPVQAVALVVIVFCLVLFGLALYIRWAEKQAKKVHEAFTDMVGRMPFPTPRADSVTQVDKVHEEIGRVPFPQPKAEESRRKPVKIASVTPRKDPVKTRPGPAKRAQRSAKSTATHYQDSYGRLHPLDPTPTDDAIRNIILADLVLDNSSSSDSYSGGSSGGASNSCGGVSSGCGGAASSCGGASGGCGGGGD